ncbi:uncharacterized protein MELLADRAFT_85293 [Melampsora larici-populina 98AG31]|uniref:Dystroglycan-type cadherin-like domain-containing protein n=1 Tax=Melampsora larici-populina (strain 98AG31 / pathotype 3-4-7) TaxID=747676 RepID=F4RI93_MELLP|nr:uncharacterized protein MELLADRAFT_85293 [Melampsora larici-populina 98AG31]EGG07966.1 hypothetical protein MELLADRAFT_85293 [Melampsora larici-populina 98AG31]
MMFFLLSIIFLSNLAQAIPSPRLSVVYPLSDQRPPVARVGVPFSWSILPGTFNSSTGNAGVTYSATNLPSWASFKSDVASIQGTPDTSHLGSISVIITAHAPDNSSSLSDKFSMLVVDSPPPRVKLPLDTQLGNGAVIGSAKYNHATKGITVPPNWSWSIGLLPDTFVTSSGAGIYYSAYEAGTTTLPSWIKFNTNTATFDGVSPNEQNDVTIVVYGSDHLGYGDLSQTFTFTVTQHTLDLVQSLPPINATAQSIINYVIPMANFNVDGSPRNSTTPVSETVDLSATPYLTHDKEHHSISGTLPESLLAQTNVTIPVIFNTPSCHNNITTHVVLRVLPGLFTAPVLPALRVQPGQAFSLDLSQYTSNLNATYSLAQISPPEAQNWIHFTTYPLTLSGTPPESYDSQGAPVTVTLQATGLNGLRSSAELPFQFDDQPASSSSSGSSLSDGGKMAIAVVFGTLGGIMLLILIMRSCRKYCSADGLRELEEEDVYQSHYAYPGEKSDIGKAVSIKETPLSLGDTFVGVHSPKWQKEAEAGGPMMVVTPNELAVAGVAQPPPKALKRLDIFNVFTKPSQRQRLDSNSHPSLRGLGIVSPDHRVINVLASSDPSAEDDEAIEEEEDDYDSEDILPPANYMRHPATSTDDQRSSWNTTGSSSLFYSDTQAEDSEAASSRSPKGKWLVKPSASVPRRRKDFKPAASRPERQSDGVDVGTIRMVVDLGSSSDANTSDDDGIGLSESFGAIKTAAYRTISPQSLQSVPAGVQEESSSTSFRPRLIAFKSQHVPNRSQSPQIRSASSSVIHDSITEDADGDGQSHIPPGQESDLGDIQRLSAHSVYTPPAPINGSPATSAIFFSPPRDQNWHISSPKIPSPLCIGYPETDRRDPDQSSHPQVASDQPSHHDSTSGSSYTASSPSPDLYRSNSSNERLNNLSGPIVVNVGVGQPFHMTPKINPPSGALMSSEGSPGRSRNHVSSSNTTYFALTYYPGQVDKDRKQLPEWLHFDPREYEVWGIPGKDDVGVLPIQIVARRTITLPGSSARQEQVEEIVARVVLDVMDQKPTSGPAHGDVSVVTF